ncbi:MAG: type I-C CRISPR-associated protein Cas7/Csd2 [Candidatus Electrothrix aestuarii]|uniref:Type I-C CRISPR-associated protein Cas7/Csd2 n=1 Tax=Candidatus Electrothrix aestuarii TaxID=3062594 RepID=A0AAU8LV75_9BACT|nr:type I-C CRISPR-associated protein Cas7/Csd2 [Candidatus Electrothrix aestuarii]
MSLENKIDFAVILSVKHANPNGDPLNGNRPRVDYEGYGEISDVCLKRKIRDRLQDQQQPIFVQSDEKKIDGMPSLKARAESEEFGLGKDTLNSKKTSPDKAAKLACEKWLDVRTFGQLFAFKGSGKDGVSIPIRGPVSIHSAFSVEPVSVASIQITKSVSGEGDGSKKGSDTMGMKHRVDEAVYVTYGSMNPQLAERTGFSNDDAETIKSVLPKLFEGDASSARPEGSMAVEKVIWWQHNCKSGQYSSAKVHRTLEVRPDGSFDLENLEGLEPEIIEGF